jgi:hypothetical protein
MCSRTQQGRGHSREENKTGKITKKRRGHSKEGHNREEATAGRGHRREEDTAVKRTQQ